MCCSQVGGRAHTKLVPNPLGLALGKDGFDSRCHSSFFGLPHITSLSLCSAELAAQQSRLLKLFMVCLQALDRITCQFLNVGDAQLHSLSRRLGSKHLGEW